MLLVDSFFCTDPDRITSFAFLHPTPFTAKALYNEIRKSTKLSDNIIEASSMLKLRMMSHHTTIARGCTPNYYHEQN